MKRVRNCPPLLVGVQEFCGFLWGSARRGACGAAVSAEEHGGWGTEAAEGQGMRIADSPRCDRGGCLHNPVANPLTRVDGVATPTTAIGQRVGHFSDSIFPTKEVGHITDRAGGIRPHSSQPLDARGAEVFATPSTQPDGARPMNGPAT